jgi:hypothetical protein
VVLGVMEGHDLLRDRWLERLKILISIAQMLDDCRRLTSYP